jgi:hypothetical protein
METPANLREALFETAEDYVKTTFDLFKLKLLQSAINVVASLISKVTVFVVVSLFILILSIGAALWLGQLTGKPHYGFFIVAGFYLLLTLLMSMFLRKWLKKPIGNMIVKQALE